MQGREELIFGEPDISLGPADGREHVFALEPRHLSGHLGNQNQCQGVFGASIGDQASVEYPLAPPAPAGPPARGAVRETTPPLPPPAATAARAAAAWVSGFPQSEQNCAPASFCRPQYWQALSAIK